MYYSSTFFTLAIVTISNCVFTMSQTLKNTTKYLVETPPIQIANETVEQVPILGDHVEIGGGAEVASIGEIVNVTKDIVFDDDDDNE